MTIGHACRRIIPLFAARNAGKDNAVHSYTHPAIFRLLDSSKTQYTPPTHLAPLMIVQRPQRFIYLDKIFLAVFSLPFLIIAGSWNRGILMKVRASMDVRGSSDPRYGRRQGRGHNENVVLVQLPTIPGKLTIVQQNKFWIVHPSILHVTLLHIYGV